MAFSSFAAWCCVHVLKTHKLERVSRETYLKRFLPVGFFMAGTLGFGNVVYLYLSVTFIQMLKARPSSRHLHFPPTQHLHNPPLYQEPTHCRRRSVRHPPSLIHTPTTPARCPTLPHPPRPQALTPVMILLVVVLARLERPSKSVIAAVLIISAGTGVTSHGEVSFRLSGFLIMMLSEACEACKLAAVQYLLSDRKFGLIEGIYRLTPLAVGWLLLFIVPLELRAMVDAGAFAVMLRNPLKFAAAASMGFVVNLLTLAVIQATSSLTFKVCFFVFLKENKTTASARAGCSPLAAPRALTPPVAALAHFRALLRHHRPAAAATLRRSLPPAATRRHSSTTHHCTSFLPHPTPHLNAPSPPPPDHRTGEERSRDPLRSAPHGECRHGCATGYRTGS